MRHLLHRQSLLTCCRAIAISWLAIAAMPMSAQETQPSQQDAVTPADSTPERPGLLNELGRLFKSPAELFQSQAKPDAAPKPDTSQQVAPAPPPAAVQTASPPATAPPPEPATRSFPGMVSGREVCPRSSNGAPDCQAGTDRLCQSKGYKAGKSLNTDSSFTCSARQARAEGRKPCGTEHYVTSAFCQ